MGTTLPGAQASNRHNPIQFGSSGVREAPSSDRHRSRACHRITSSRRGHASQPKIKAARRESAQVARASGNNRAIGGTLGCDCHQYRGSLQPQRIERHPSPACTQRTLLLLGTVVSNFYTDALDATERIWSVTHRHDLFHFFLLRNSNKAQTPRVGGLNEIQPEFQCSGIPRSVTRASAPLANPGPVARCPARSEVQLHCPRHNSCPLRVPMPSSFGLLPSLLFPGLPPPHTPAWFVWRGRACKRLEAKHQGVTRPHRDWRSASKAGPAETDDERAPSRRCPHPNLPIPSSTARRQI